MHLGVASCAGSNCHGSTSAEPPSQGVLHNEYLTWQRKDAHARAYRDLLAPRALAIGRRLGISEPAQSETCLDCHTDDVPANKRGSRFSLSDGVGCEACHGGASKWIVDHAVAHRSHTANLAEGMYPTDDPTARTRLCLGCHYGTSDKPMTHAIMEAGHPPLLFELTTFTAIQPAHYRVDDDYRSRKHYAGPAEAWAIGQAVTAELVLGEFADRSMRTPAGKTPDFYLYSCYSCHQPLDPDSPYLPAAAPAPLPDASRLPLTNPSLRMLGIILDAADPARVGPWRKALDAFQTAATPGAAAEAARQLNHLAADAAAFLAQKPLDSEEQRRIAVALAQEGTHAVYSARSLADQTVMALTALYHADGESSDPGAVFGPGFPAALDSAYKALSRVSVFDVAGYRAAMVNIDKSIK